MKDYTLEKRKYVIGAAAIVIVLIYVFRLFDLQIMTDDYKKNADSNAFLNKIQYPSRGAIYVCASGGDAAGYTRPLQCLEHYP